MDFWGRAARNFRLPKVRHKITEKIRVTQTDLEKMENKTLRWYGHVARMENKRWPKLIMTWSPEGRRRRENPEVTWEKEVKKVMKRGNLISDDATKRQICMNNLIMMHEISNTKILTF